MSERGSFRLSQADGRLNDGRKWSTIISSLPISNTLLRALILKSDLSVSAVTFLHLYYFYICSDTVCLLPYPIKILC
jgi:hypothetical protein